MRYAVFGGGQRVRPLLSLRIARVLDSETPAVLRAASCAELVHCASLIVDDLPCMDDSPTRRGLPATHVQFGESTAILAAFSLVALAARSTAALPRFQRNLLGVLDPGSLIRGQALDLESPAPARSALITELKTVPLFELAVEAGGVSSSQYDRREQELRRFARAFGLAFQMVDDYLDRDTEDPEPALDQLARARNAADELGPRGHHLLELVNYLDVKLSEDRSHR